MAAASPLLTPRFDPQPGSYHQAPDRAESTTPRGAWQHRVRGKETSQPSRADRPAANVEAKREPVPSLSQSPRRALCAPRSASRPRNASAWPRRERTCVMIAPGPLRTAERPLAPLDLAGRGIDRDSEVAALVPHRKPDQCIAISIKPCPQARRLDHRRLCLARRIDEAVAVEIDLHQPCPLATAVRDRPRCSSARHWFRPLRPRVEAEHPRLRTASNAP
jgi:hypothetical protein